MEVFIKLHLVSQLRGCGERILNKSVERFGVADDANDYRPIAAIEIDLALLCTRQVGEVHIDAGGRPHPPASKTVIISVVTPKEGCSSRN